MLTPSTPERAIENSVSITHRAEANVSLTPGMPLQATELSSSTRKVAPWLCAYAISSPAPLSSPRVEAGASRLGIDG